MANQEHLDLLLKSSRANNGMQEWNQWRADHSDINPDLSEAYLEEIALNDAYLFKVNLTKTNLSEASLTGAILNYANLSGANLFNANLTKASISMANLSGANLLGADLSNANLWRSTLNGANFINVTFSPATELREIKLSSQTQLGDIHWNGVDLTTVDWEPLTHLGDDISKYLSASDRTRANRQLATQLRQQSINDHADRFAYHAQIWQRRTLRQKKTKRFRNFINYFGSLFLDLLAGYGYRPVRTLIAYLLVIGGFLLLYTQFGVVDATYPTIGMTSSGSPIVGYVPGHTLNFQEAFIFSLTSFHGRGFFPGGLGLDSPITMIAAIEAVIGLVIEVSFIATFTQRFFGR
jgi:uncharacterized protein YjbI with pentapeptide repeats